MPLPDLECTLQTFHAISKMDVGLFDAQYRCIRNLSACGTTFCQELHKHRPFLKMCLASDKRAFLQVEQSGAAGRYTCPFGFSEMLVPIFENDVVVAYLIGGPAVEVDGNGQPVNGTDDDLPLEFRTEARRALLTKIPHYTREQLDAFYQTFLLFAQYIESKGFLSAQNRSLGQMIKAYICANLGEKITLADLSTKLHCSTVTLTENFRHEFGITIAQYMTGKRIRLAKKQLLETGNSISEIAGSCGFSDLAYFSRCFRNTTGQSPSEYRRTRNQTDNEKRGCKKTPHPQASES